MVRELNCQKLSLCSEIKEILWGEETETVQVYPRLMECVHILNCLNVPQVIGLWKAENNKGRKVLSQNGWPSLFGIGHFRFVSLPISVVS